MNRLTGPHTGTHTVVDMHTKQQAPVHLLPVEFSMPKLQEHPNLAHILEVSSKLPQDPSQLNPEQHDALSKLGDQIIGVKASKSYKNSEWWSLPERNLLVKLWGKLLGRGDFAKHVDALNEKVLGLNVRKVEDVYEPAAGKISVDRKTLAGNYAMTYPKFEKQNSLKSFGKFKGLEETHPSLYEKYARQNSPGDGSCWLTAMLYTGFDAMNKDPQMRVNFLAKLESVKSEFEEKYPRGGAQLVDEVSRLVESMGEKLATYKSIAMSKAGDNGILRKFSREFIAMKVQEQGGSAEDVKRILDPNGEGEVNEIGIFSSEFGLNTYVLDETGAFSAGAQKFQLLNSDMYTNVAVPKVEDLVSQKAKFLLYTQGHYSILEPTQ